MAAKEKTQQAQHTKAAPPPAPMAAPDLLMDFDAPASENAPPPSYDTNFLPPPPPQPFAPVLEAPPAFGVLHSQTMFPPPPPIESLMPPPPPMENVLPPPSESSGGFMMGPPAASAPSFEDLLGGFGGGGVVNSQQSEYYPVPPPVQPPALDIDESILNALEPAEREAFLEEQRKIMEQIEKEKKSKDTNSAAARAAAFDQRSSAAVAEVAASYEGTGGRSRSKPADTIPGIPIEDMDAAAQLVADAELAEMLQKEEYEQAGRSSESSSGRRRRDPQPAQPQAAGATATNEGQSWYDWLVGAPASTTAAANTSNRSAEVRRQSGGLVAAQTGEEGGIGHSRSYDESRGLMGGGSGGGARVAEPKSMFACVADSISTAATQMYALPTDEEGNVHGVDSTSLLAMPDVSRQRE
jgi:hypothetical protein